MLVVHCLLLLLSLVSGRPLLSQPTDRRRLNRLMSQSKVPLFLYGFPRETPVLDSEYQVELERSSTLTCPHSLKVLVHKATLHCSSDLDCTETIRAKCLQKETCSVHPRDCMTAPCKAPICSLNYSCELAKDPKPLYNGLEFIEGVFPDFLVVEKGNVPLNPPTVQLERCAKSESCKYVVQGSDFLYADDSFDNANSHIFVKKNQFMLPGYAVLLNYAGICNKQVYPKAKTFYEVVKEANPLTFRAFSLGTTPPISIHL